MEWEASNNFHKDGKVWVWEGLGGSGEESDGDGVATGSNCWYVVKMGRKVMGDRVWTGLNWWGWSGDGRKVMGMRWRWGGKLSRSVYVVNRQCLNEVDVEPYLDWLEPYLDWLTSYLDWLELYLDWLEPYLDWSEPYLDWSEPYLDSSEPYLDWLEPCLDWLESYLDWLERCDRPSCCTALSALHANSTVRCTRRRWLPALVSACRDIPSVTVSASYTPYCQHIHCDSKKNFTPTTFMITVWNENQFK